MRCCTAAGRGPPGPEPGNHYSHYMDCHGFPMDCLWIAYAGILVFLFPTYHFFLHVFEAVCHLQDRCRWLLHSRLLCAIHRQPLKRAHMATPRGLGPSAGFGEGSARTVRATAAAVGLGAVRGAWGGMALGREGGFQIYQQR